MGFVLRDWVEELCVPLKCVLGARISPGQRAQTRGEAASDRLPSLVRTIYDVFECRRT